MGQGFWSALFWAVFMAEKSVLIVTPVFAAFALLERYGPCHGERPRAATQVRGVVFQLIGVSVGTVLVFLTWRWLPRMHPLFPVLSLPMAFLASDFLQYWEHRFEHRFAWRFHSVHHATREMSGTSNFTHFTHALFMQAIYGTPMALLAYDPMPIPVILAAIYAWSTFIHSPTRLSLGPLRWVLMDNRGHRIHHALDSALHERNFGSILTVWDVLFGTMHWPKRGEWPATGVADYGEIDTVRDFLLRPFLPGH